MKRLHTLFKPMLLYASDFWGILKLPKNNPLETLFLSFRKQLLGVQKKHTTNTGILLELGMAALNFYARKNAVQNWNRIAKFRKANAITTLSYFNAMSKELSWRTQIKKSISLIGMMEIFISDNTPDPNTPQNFFQRLIDIFHQEAFPEISVPTSKLRTYKITKLK